MNSSAIRKPLDLPPAREGQDSLIRLRYRAFSSHHRGDLKAAEAAYQQILARTPGDLEVRQALGVLALQNRNYAWALQLLSQVAHTHDSADLQDHLGCAFYGLSRFEEALRCHERAVALDRAAAAVATAVPNAINESARDDLVHCDQPVEVPAQLPVVATPPAAARPASVESSTLRRLDWRVRLIGAAPTIASCVLAALLASELAATAFALLSRKSPPAINDMPTPARTATVRFDVSSIVTAHLFGVAEQNPTPAPAAAARVDLKLTGTLAGDDPHHGIAIIGDQDASDVYAVGESLGGATLHEVYQDHVILERNGSFESLSLPRERTQLASIVPPGNPIGQGEFATPVALGLNRAVFMKWGLLRDDIVVAGNGT